MNERFTLESTVTEITENDRVNKKLPIFFDLELCSRYHLSGMGEWPAENDGGRSENSRYVFGIRVSGIYSEYEGRQ